MELILKSTLEDIDAWCHELRESLSTLVGKKDRFKVELAVREALSNALEHGNNYNPGLTLKISWSVTPGVFTFQVTDQGDGFIPGTPALPGDDLQDHGRGVSILGLYTRDLAWSDGGRTVSFKLDLNPEEQNV